MGLFDFFKKKPEPSQMNDGPSPEYALAHLALRHIALSDPIQFLAIVASPEADRFIDSIIKNVKENCGRKPSFDATSVKIATVRVNEFPCAILEFPAPNEIAEAFMVGVIVEIDSSSEQPTEIETTQARYFTLEKGYSDTNELRTVLGEWTEDSHLNYGDGPPPTVEAFVEFLSEMLQNSESE